jgi:glycosyltransferase involved in cell wall biosynthesis
MISFIIPAYNEEKYLGATLAAIHAAMKQVGEPFEIVVANDASSDGTAAMAEQAGARVVTAEKRQIAGTRNSGARASTGEVLIFVDADTQVSGPLVAEALAELRAGAVGGGAPVRFDQAPRWVKNMLVVFVPIYFWTARWAAGCFIFCTRAAYDAAGGFDETLYASQEISFSRALKHLGRFVILKERVTTSARKTHGQTPWSMLWMTLCLAAGGMSSLKKRDGRVAQFWYPDKR